MVDQATINPETPSSDQTDFKSAISGLGVPSTVADPLSRLFQKSGEYQVGQMAAQSRQKGLEMGAKAYAAAQEAQTLRKEAVPYQQALAQPAPKFNVTQDTQEGMMGLTALLPLAGLFMGAKGQMSGINAMNAMAGVLKGYQEGNQQRIAFEKQKYDAAMKEWDSHIKNIKAGFDLAVKLAATDREASEAKKMEAAYATGSREMIALAQKSSAAQMAATITQMVIEKEKQEARAAMGGTVAVIDPVTRQKMLVTKEQATQAANAGHPYEPAGRYMSPEDFAARGWLSPSGQGGKNMTALNTVAQHLNQLEKLGDALNNGDYPTINRIANAYNVSVGKDNVTNFNAARQNVATEIVKIITGTGGALADRTEAENVLNAAQSPAQLKGAIETIKSLIGGRLNSFKTQYEAAGLKNFDKLLTEDAAKQFGKYAGVGGPSTPQGNSNGQASGGAIPPDISVSGW